MLIQGLLGGLHDKLDNSLTGSWEQDLHEQRRRALVERAIDQFVPGLLKKDTKYIDLVLHANESTAKFLRGYLGRIEGIFKAQQLWNTKVGWYKGDSPETHPYYSDPSAKGEEVDVLAEWLWMLRNTPLIPGR